MTSPTLHHRGKERRAGALSDTRDAALLCVAIPKIEVLLQVCEHNPCCVCEWRDGLHDEACAIGSLTNMVRTYKERDDG